MDEDVGSGGGGAARSVVSMRTMEAIVAAILLLFGLTFMYSSYTLGFRWGSEGPQSGFFPFYVSLIVAGASAVILVHALLARDAKSKESFVERGQLKQVLSVLFPAAVFILGIQLIGIYISSALYISLFMRMLGKYPLKRSIALGIVISGLFFVMFEIWFQVPLYKGYWDLTSWTGY